LLAESVSADQSRTAASAGTPCWHEHANLSGLVSSAALVWAAVFSRL